MTGPAHTAWGAWAMFIVILLIITLCIIVPIVGNHVLKGTP